MYNRIMIATDGSAMAGRAIKAGVELAKRTGASIVAFSAYEPVTAHLDLEDGNYLDASTSTLLERAARDGARKHVAAVAKAAAREGLQCKLGIVKSRDAADGILRVAGKTKCDVIVMASHGRRGLTRLLLGSVTQRVLARARIPVLVWR